VNIITTIDYICAVFLVDILAPHILIAMHRPHTHSERVKKMIFVYIAWVPRRTLTPHPTMSIPTMSIQHYEITDKEKLRDHVHHIHDFLRNHGVGIGMTALKIFNMFYGLKVIDGKKRKELGLAKACSWREIKKLDPEELLMQIIGRTPQGKKTMTSILDELAGNEKTKSTIFFEIPRDVSASTYHKLVRMVDQIPATNVYDVDLAGKIYEYFIGYGDKTSMCELGAYFTDRHITTFIIKEINPQITYDLQDKAIGYVPRMIDPFGGSGGFTLTYTRWMQDNYGKHINWKTQIDKIHHQDLSEDVVKSATLEMYVLTGFFPPTTDINGLARGNFRRTNTFQESQQPHTYDYILSNPPYGGDKNKKNAEQLRIESLVGELEKRFPTLKQSGKKKTKKNDDEDDIVPRPTRVQYDQMKQRIKEIASENKKDTVNIHTCNMDLYGYLVDLGGCDSNGNPLIPANDKEACSLLLFMRLVAINGTVVGVLKEGVFFDSKYSEIRRVLLENFNVEQVIGVPCDEFENTTTKTSILIFRNNGKTRQVVFSELVVSKHSADEFAMVDCILRHVHRKDQIKGVEKKILCKASFDQISTHQANAKHPYSLDPKTYIGSTAECSDKYELVCLGSNKICEFGAKSKRSASHGQPTGLYNFYTSSDNVKKCDTCDYKDEYVMIGTGGNSCLHTEHLLYLT